MDNNTPTPNMQGLTDDDLAATLGYLTSIMEMQMGPMDQETDMQEEEPQESQDKEAPEKEEEPEVQAEEDNVDAEMQKQIDDIRAELETLKAEEDKQENEGEPEKTEDK